MGLRSALRRRIQGETETSDLLGAALGAGSKLYGIGNWLRGYCLEKRILNTHRLPRPVISVGNLTLGGTGKTPLVILIAQLLTDMGYKVAILSRGYARKGGDPIQVVSEGSGALCEVDHAGDEPFMMAHRLRGVHIWVGRRRHHVGLKVWERARPDVFMLDDGFQHRRLHRDLDVVIIRAPRPFGNGKLLPAGPLREPPSALQRADLLVINTAVGPNGGREPGWGTTSISPSTPVLLAKYQPRGFLKCGEDRLFPIDAMSGQKVALVCGIGNPEAFKGLVSSLGAQIVRSLFFPDHYWYTPRDMAAIRHCLRGVDAVVTTEKDKWKIQKAGAPHDWIWALQVDLEIEQVHQLGEHLTRCLAVSHGGFVS